MKIAILTATRADFGKLKSVLLELQAEFDVEVLVSGMHMLSKYGRTRSEVERSGAARIVYLYNQRVGDSMDRVLAKTIEVLGDHLNESRPELLIVHGDRVEAIAGALAGALNNVPVAHIEGGEVSGTIDEHLRHAITKLSQLHFVANEEARQRVLQLGEHPESVFVTGSPDLDVMSSDKLPQTSEALGHYGIPWTEYGLCLFHPVTTESQLSFDHATELINALAMSEHRFVVIYPNNDHGSEAVLDAYAPFRAHERLMFFPSIRFEYFLALLKGASLCVGNSSAGVREAPFFGVASVNVGSRQNGRSKAESIANAECDRAAVASAIEQMWGKRFQPSQEFGDGRSAQRVLEVIRSYGKRGLRVQKQFRDLSDG